MAANQVRDHMRRRKLRLVHDTTTDLQQRREATHESRLAIERALQQLPDSQRLVVLLHDVDGFKHHEIADMLEIAEGTSKARLSRARALLREMLSGQVEETRP